MKSTGRIDWLPVKMREIHETKITMGSPLGKWANCDTIDWL